MFLYTAQAHELFTSYTSIEIRGDRLVCVFTLDQTDLSMIFDLDEDGNGEVSKDELLLNLDDMYDYVEENSRVIIGGEVLELARQGASVTEDNLGNVFAKFDFAQKLSFQPWKLTLGLSFFQDLGPRHKNLAKVLYGSEMQQTIFTVGDPEQSFSFEGQDAKLTSQIQQFVWLGTEHILIGYDHILFLLGLIIIGGSFTNLVKITMRVPFTRPSICWGFDVKEILRTAVPLLAVKLAPFTFRSLIKTILSPA